VDDVLGEVHDPHLDDVLACVDRDLDRAVDVDRGVDNLDRQQRVLGRGVRPLVVITAVSRDEDVGRGLGVRGQTERAPCRTTTRPSTAGMIEESSLVEVAACGGLT
jgi:hypothetical protein